MDITDLKVQVVIVLVGVAVLWVLLKTMKWVWRVGVVVAILLVLSFVLPALREWLFGLF